MKKILVVALSVALLLSTTACGTNSELEALKQENEQLKEKLDYDLQWAFKYDKQVGNWNKLKKYLHNQIPTDKTVLTKYIKIFEVLDKMQELEQGSDK